MPPLYGQVVVGPPGSGKTTYCDGMQQYLSLLGRNAVVVNLDPANEEELPYSDALLWDVCSEMVQLSSVMEKLNLGPNGGLVYCWEYIEAHVDELIESLRAHVSEKAYLLLDLPGQVELYTHSTVVQDTLQRLVKALDLRLTAVQLIDAQYCTDATKFLSASLLGTTTMLRLELPMVNVLSKVDLLASYGQLPLPLDFFTECHELERLVPFVDPLMHTSERTELEDGEEDEVEYDIMDDPDYQAARRRRRALPFAQKYTKLHEAIADVVNDFALLNFVPLDISSAESVGRVLAKIDKSNGYVFTEASVNEDVFQCAIQSDNAYEGLADVREHISSKESIKELRREL